jgi:hypothetical protein
MARPSSSRSFVSLSVFVLAVSINFAAAQEAPPAVCDLLIHEEQSELETAALSVSLARSNFAAYERIVVMIEGLWEAKAIDRMSYIEARYDRDAARLTLEEADLLLERQSLLVEQLRLLCGADGPRGGERDQAIRDAYLRYRKADCDSLAKAIEVAATNLEFNRELLRSVLDLREANVATKADVILAELEVEREEKSLADARRRAQGCRDALAREGPIPERERPEER